MIRLSDITKAYERPDGGEGHVVFRGLDLRVGEGELVCVLGPSGCGKSTLLNLVAGFLRPTGGNVFFDGREVTAPGPQRGVVFQDPTLFPWLTVHGNVAFGLRSLGVPPDRRERRVTGALEMVGLRGFEDAYPHALSGGMRQRAALARVLVLEPKALLMDEPFSALDANSRERLQDELLRIWEAHRRTVLFVTHNVAEAAYLAERVVVMGPPPEGIRAEVRVELPRPRDRASDAMRAVLRVLRSHLDGMPCCIPPEQGAAE
jgi:NitT/TauT family transport system ATP-binding protein